MFFTYIIKSIKTEKYYIGSTENIENRLKRHNFGHTKSVKNQGSFALIYQEAFETRSEAYKRERQLKRFKGGEAFKKLVQS